MKEITIDCANLTDRAQLHRIFAEALDFPDWYGCNLDALHDLLAAISEDVHLTVLDLPLPGFRRVLQDAVEENPHLTVTIQ